MITEPKLEDRNAQPYVGIRTQVPMKEFKGVVPQLLGEVFAWLEKQGVPPAGAPFMRFHVINMAEKMDIEMGGPGAGREAEEEEGCDPFHDGKPHICDARRFRAPECEPNRHPGRMSEQPEEQRKSIDNSGCDQQTARGPHNNADGTDGLDESTDKQERSQKAGWRSLEQDTEKMDDGCTHRQEGSPVEESPSLDTIGEQEREPTRRSVIRDWHCLDTHS